MNACCLILLTAILGSAEAPWTVASDEDGFLVEQREGAGAVEEFRAEGLVDGTPESCLDVVRSDDFFSRTAPNVKEARVVAAEGERVRWFYARIDPPFVAPRDYTLRIEVGETATPEGMALRMSWRIDNARGPPPVPGTVRVERTQGAWSFVAVEGGRTRVRYQLEADPGGSIPRWISRRAQLAGIVAAFEELGRATARRTP